MLAPGWQQTIFAFMEQAFKTKAGATVLVSPMRQSDLAAADQVMRLAFGTFLGMPDPLGFMGDASYIATRWNADPGAAFCARMNDEVIGSVMAGNWGSVGFLGPLTSHPKVWDQGVAQKLMAPVMECFRAWGSSHLGLYTFAQSVKHVSLYRKFGFYPRFLTAIMAKPVQQRSDRISWSGFSAGTAAERESFLKQCYILTDGVFEGLNVNREVQSVFSQSLGETVLLWSDGALAGMAVCHCGPRTEAGTGTCYIKFGVVSSGANAGRHFEDLLTACEQLAAERSLTRMVGGMNMARREAYQLMLANGYTAIAQGVAMEQPDAGYNRAGIFIIDDWR